MRGQHIISNETMYLSSGEKKTGVADFTNKLLYASETLSSVTSVTQHYGPGTLTLSSGTINSSADTVVDDLTVAQNKGVQSTVDARGCPAGRYMVQVTAVTSVNEILTIDCLVEVCAARLKQDYSQFSGSPAAQPVTRTSGLETSPAASLPRRTIIPARKTRTRVTRISP